MTSQSYTQSDGLFAVFLGGPERVEIGEVAKRTYNAAAGWVGRAPNSTPIPYEVLKRQSTPVLLFCEKCYFEQWAIYQDGPCVYGPYFYPAIFATVSAINQIVWDERRGQASSDISHQPSSRLTDNEPQTGFVLGELSPPPISSQIESPPARDWEAQRSAETSSSQQDQMRNNQIEIEELQGRLQDMNQEPQQWSTPARQRPHQ